MGAWGTDTFDNDTACDWAYELEGVADLTHVEQAIAGVLQIGSDYLDADAASRALAACEVIARLKGNFGARNAYTETVDSWVSQHRIASPSDLVTRAVAVVDRILTEPSELVELWADSDEGAIWRTAVSDLRRRTTG